MKEDSERNMPTQDRYNVVASKLNSLHGEETMLPPQCPDCGSVKITHLAFSGSSLECLSCNEQFYMLSYNHPELDKIIAEENVRRENDS